MQISKITRLETILMMLRAQTDHLGDFEFEVETFGNDLVIIFEDDRIFDNLSRNHMFGNFRFFKNGNNFNISIEL